MTSTKRRRRRRTVILAGVAVLLAIGCTPSTLGFISMYGLLYSPCGNEPQTPASYGHTTYEDLTLTASAGGSFRAYFVPGQNRAAVIIPPPHSGGRGARLHEADVLIRHGYAVLTFESRRCAGMGALSLGYKEMDEVGDALAYLKTRPDVDPARIGILGFSSAGATSVMATARYPEFRAVAAEGGYGDFAEGAVGIGVGDETVLEMIYKGSLGISYRVITGMDIDKLSPIDVIGQIAPRPILLIYGSEERSLEGAYDQLAAAGDNADLWVVPGATHGNYLYVAPEEYERRVVTFFDAALLGD
ncbi:MAG: prolyl oligopeptidase family serine peptidase [Anaerolineae bacterium]|nr:prolyl oligopeptidase family serine peptidase [Anaerolineae bacterium]